MPARARLMFGGLSKLATAVPLAAMACMVASSMALAQDAPPGGEAPPVPVTVVTMQPQDVTLTAMLPGRIVASGVAEVRPQVNGLITGRLFDEGERVALGEALYRLDAASYEAAVELARAEVGQGVDDLVARIAVIEADTGECGVRVVDEGLQLEITRSTIRADEVAQGAAAGAQRILERRLHRLDQRVAACPAEP